MGRLLERAVGWVDGWMDGWMDGWNDGWMDTRGYIRARMHGRVDRMFIQRSEDD